MLFRHKENNKEIVTITTTNKNEKIAVIDTETNWDDEVMSITAIFSFLLVVVIVTISLLFSLCLNSITKIPLNFSFCYCINYCIHKFLFIFNINFIYLIISSINDYSLIKF